MKKHLLAIGFAAIAAVGSAFSAANVWTAGFVPSQVQIMTNLADSKSYLVVYDKAQVGYATTFSGTTAAAWYDMAKTSMVTNIPIVINYDPDQQLTTKYCTDMDAAKVCTANGSWNFFEFRQMVVRALP